MPKLEGRNRQKEVKVKRIALIATLLSLVGCISISTTTVSKTVTIEKDVDGKVLKVIESETVSQVGDIAGEVIVEHVTLRTLQPKPTPIQKSPSDSPSI